jgi:hypothetical protein
VLAGVGGRTVAEAKERMAYSEALRWMAYVKKRGRPNLGLRIEEVGAHIVQAVYRSQGGKCDAEALMPHVVAQDEEAASIDDLMGVLNASSKTNKYLERRRNGN